MKMTGCTGFCVAAGLLMATVTAYAEDASCVFQVSQQAVSVGNGGVVDLQLISSRPDCVSDIKSDADWVTVTPGQLHGSGTVRIDVAPCVDRRIGVIEIAGQRITVFQQGVPLRHTR